MSDIVDCAHANAIGIAKIVSHHPTASGARDIAMEDRIAAWGRLGQAPVMQDFAAFVPEMDEIYLLGPTTPARAGLVADLERRFDLSFTTLVHPTAYVSPLATLGPGVFVGANSVIGPGARLDAHVFVNRGVTIGHDTRIGAYSRIQPGSHIGGLSRLETGVTIGIGATLIERLVIGAHGFVAAGAVVVADVPPDVMVAGNPARFSRSLAGKS